MSELKIKVILPIGENDKDIKNNNINNNNINNNYKNIFQINNKFHPYRNQAYAELNLDEFYAN